MALTFMDSCDHYTTNAEFLTKWSTGQNNPAPTAVGRFGGGGFHLNGNGSSIYRALPSDGTMISGHARKLAGFGAVATQHMHGGTIQTYVQVEGTGQISVYNGAGALLCRSASAPCPVGSYNYWEFKTVVDPAAGSVEVRINNVSVCSAAGVVTSHDGSSLADGVNHLGVANADDLCDFYMANGTGGVLTDFAGDSRIECLFPAGPGTYSAWTPTGALTDWQATNEVTPDGDATYISDNVVGDKDTMTYGPLVVVAGTVAGVQICPYVRKDDAGARTVANMARLAAVDAIGTPFGPGTSYTYFPEVMELDPSGSAWTIPNVNIAEFGAEVAS